MTATAHVLVIDDSSTLRKLVEIAFRGSQTTVAFAATGAEGIERAVAEPPDVILLDFILPDMRGVEVCQRLLRYGPTSHVPIVVMSGNHEGVVELFREMPQVVDFVPKPFSTDEIGRRLRTAMRGGGSANPLDGTTRFRRGSLAPLAPAPTPTLILAAELATVGLPDVLRLLQAARLSGTAVVVAEAESCVIHLASGDVLACTGQGPDGDATDDLVELRAVDEQEIAKIRREIAASGKPVLIGLAEAGLVRSADVPALLRANSKRLLARALGLRQGRVEWRAAAAIPSWLEVFGRPLSIASLVLDQARPAGDPTDAAAPAFLDEIYQRTPNFSRIIANARARLSSKEQAVLALIDGALSVRIVLDRAGLGYDRGAALISRLRTAGLIQNGPLGVSTPGTPTSPIAILDSDRDGFIAPLRSHLRRRPQPVDAIDLTDAIDIAGALERERPQLLLVSETAVEPREFAQRLGPLTRGGGMALVALLDAPAPIDDFLRAGYDAVLIKPVHIAEIERLLSY